MARPIAETPTLRGQDAIRFMQAMENPKPLSQRELREQKKAYELVKSRADFSL
jgi:hypothetical protein